MQDIKSSGRRKCVFFAMGGGKQWVTAASDVYKRQHLEQGVRLNDELAKIFKDKVIGFPTLMEVIE